MAGARDAFYFGPYRALEERREVLVHPLADQRLQLVEHIAGIVAQPLVKHRAEPVANGLLEYGLVGACMGCLIAHVLAALFTFAVAIKRFSLPVPYVHIGKIALATLLMAILLTAAPWAPTRLGLSLEILGGALLYAALLVLFYRRGLQALIAAARLTKAEPAAPR